MPVLLQRKVHLGAARSGERNVLLSRAGKGLPLAPSHLHSRAEQHIRLSCDATFSAHEQDVHWVQSLLSWSVGRPAGSTRAAARGRRTPAAGCGLPARVRPGPVFRQAGVGGVQSQQGSSSHTCAAALR